MLDSKKMMKINSARDILILWLTGGILYFYMEILCRGYSHVSMLVCAGICFVLVGRIGAKWLSKRVTWNGLAKTFVLGAMIISAMELATGIIVNVWLGLRVWDYSKLRYNFLGQVCPTYTCLWGIVSIPAVYLYMLINVKIFQDN